MLKLNLNCTVRVKLTDYGRNIYYHQYDEINEKYGKIICKPTFPKVDADGFTEFQLHTFMNIYGEYLFVGNRNVIEDINIYVNEEDLTVWERSSNEEEVMRKADCCEWKPTKNNKNVVHGHDEFLKLHEVYEWNFCPICGKPIKISEVE